RLVFYARNPRKNDAVVDRMCSSIREFGFKIPCLARSDGEVVDGHLRLKAARQLGSWPGGDTTAIPVILCDEWTPAQVKAFRLMVNRSVSWAAWDLELLGAEFMELKAMDFDLSLTGFDTREIDQFTLSVNPDEDRSPPLPEVPVSRPATCGSWAAAAGVEGAGVVGRSEGVKMSVGAGSGGRGMEDGWGVFPAAALELELRAAGAGGVAGHRRLGHGRGFRLWRPRALGFSQRDWREREGAGCALLRCAACALPPSLCELLRPSRATAAKSSYGGQGGGRKWSAGERAGCVLLRCAASALRAAAAKSSYGGQGGGRKWRLDNGLGGF